MPRLVHHDYSVEEVGELTPLTSKWDDPPRHFCLGDKLWIICANHDTMKTRQNSHFDAGLVFQRISWSIIIFFGGWQDFWRTDICKHFFFRTKRRDCCGDPFGVWGEAPEAPSKKLEHGLTCWVLGLLGILCKIVSSNQQLSSIFIAQRFVVRITHPQFFGAPQILRVSIHTWDDNLEGLFFLSWVETTIQCNMRIWTKTGDLLKQIQPP